MSDGEPLVEKWKPESLSEVQGHNKDLKEIQAWAEDWSPGDKPQLLVGEPGIGKTATARALANEMGWEILELNASEAAGGDDVERIAGQMQSDSIRGGRTLILLDETDSWHHAVNMDPLSTALKDPQNPVIAVANESWQVPNAISRRCNEREFSLGKRSIKAKLKEIAKAEDFDVTPQDIGKLATRGNLRAAIQDLQRFADGDVDWNDRTDETSSFDAMDKFIRGEQAYNVELNPEELVVWLDENLSKDYGGLECAMAYDALARADVRLAQSRDASLFTSDDYRFWKYGAQLAEMAADLRLTEPYDGYIKTSYPEWFRHSTPKPTDDSAEASLYRGLSGFDDNTFHFGGGFHYFRRVILPMLTDLPEVVRLRLALEAGIGDDSQALDALDLSKRRYDDWLSEEGDETYEDEVQQGIDDW